MKICIKSEELEPLKPSGNKCRQCKKPAIVSRICKSHFCELIEKRVKKTIMKYNLISKKDKVLVAYSGGKDSTVLLYILNKWGYSIEALTLNAYIGCYSKENLENAIKFCKQQNIKLHQISFRKEFGYSLCYLRSLLEQKGANLKSCTICGVLRRYLLNREARTLGATKIAFGHNMDDEVQSILMNFLKGDIKRAARMWPVTGIIKDKSFVQRIKPLYFVKEDEIVLYSRIKEFPVKYGACPCSIDSYRYCIRRLIKESINKYPDLKDNIIDIFLQLAPILKQNTKKTEQPNICIRCGEPTAQKVCKTCDIILQVTKK